MNTTDLSERLLQFAVRVIKISRKLGNEPEEKVIRYQITQSGTSPGANYEEAQSASSTADFRNKNEIVLRELKETRYWLRVIKLTTPQDKTILKEINYLLAECEELIRIFSSIILKVKKKG